MAKFKFKKVKVCVVASYGPSEGSDDDECMKFWNDMKETLERVSGGFRIIVLCDLNGWVGDRKRDGITGGYGVEGEIENGKKVIDFCAEKGMCISNKYLF